MEYIGEHTLIGQVGHFFVLVAFSAALLACVSYFFASKDESLEKGSWLKIARLSFRVHSAAVFTVIGLIFFMIANQYFEYNYVWKHSNTIMPMRYIFSCFWEGQEGSFLLWTFWHVILGLILQFRAKKWEAPVMTTFSLVQVFLVSMVMGIYVFDFKFGSSPFTLIREMPDNIGLPWTMSETYLQLPAFADGRGLNPLLQNYWMTIHPPTLFLGFASTLVPFCYAIAGLWKGKLSEWMRPAAPWAFFGVMVLGVGILMGGAWAYEALSFGGFWAWDPVENASLVPWITFVGAAHIMLIKRKKKVPSYLGIILTLLTFILILYSTFLTRSGVLGESSVHSFTGNGMLEQLLVYLLFFIWLAVLLLIKKGPIRTIYIALTAILVLFDIGFTFSEFSFHAIAIVTFVALAITMCTISYVKNFPKEKKDDELWSREFWMFIGALVLLLSAFQIIVVTSIPVYNLIFGAEVAPPAEPIEHYNRWQLPFALIITFLMGMGQFLKYKKTDRKKFFKSLDIPFYATVALTALLIWMIGYDLAEEWQYVGLLFTGVFAVLANLDYLVRTLKGKFNFAGGSIAHIGFGLIILGALISTSKSDYISQNVTTVDIENLGESMNNNESILLVENDTFPMGKYYVVYQGRRLDGINMLYEVDYYNSKPVDYKQGDLIFTNQGLYEAAADHEASLDFAEDLGYWRPVQSTGELMSVAKPWQATEITDFAFTLAPRVQLSEKFENTPEPDTRHTLAYDIYTHVQYADLSDPSEQDSVPRTEDGYSEYTAHDVGVGDTVIASNTFIVIDSIVAIDTADYGMYAMAGKDIGSIVHISVIDGNLLAAHLEGLAILRDSVLPVSYELGLEEKGIKLQVANFRPGEGKITLGLSELEQEKQDVIVLQAIVFPAINVLWLGIILMFVGSFMAMRHRKKINLRAEKAEADGDSTDSEK